MSQPLTPPRCAAVPQVSPPSRCRHRRPDAGDSSRAPIHPDGLLGPRVPRAHGLSRDALYLVITRCLRLLLWWVSNAFELFLFVLSIVHFTFPLQSCHGRRGPDENILSVSNELSCFQNRWVFHQHFNAWQNSLYFSKLKWLEDDKYVTFLNLSFYTYIHFTIHVCLNETKIIKSKSEFIYLKLTYT